MNKKYLIAGGIIIVLVCIAIFVFVFQQNSTSRQALSQPSSLKSQNPAALNYGNQPKTYTNTKQSVTLAPPANTPQEAVQQFYTYYFSSPTNPLANGAYKKNPYLSPDFKNVIGVLYNNGNIPVFCPENRWKNIVVGKETPVNYSNAILMQEVISEAPPGNKDLYRILVQQDGNNWLIYDINCIQ